MVYSAGTRAGAYVIGIVGLKAATALLKAGMHIYDAIARTPEDRINMILNEAQYYSNQGGYSKMLSALAAAERVSNGHGLPVPTQRMQELHTQTMARITGSEGFHLEEAKKYLRALVAARGNLPQRTDIDRLEVLIKREEALREHSRIESEKRHAEHPAIWNDS